MSSRIHDYRGFTIREACDNGCFDVSVSARGNGNVWYIGLHRDDCERWVDEVIWYAERTRIVTSAMDGAMLAALVWFVGKHYKAKRRMQNTYAGQSAP